MTPNLRAVPSPGRKPKEKVLVIHRLSKGFHTAGGYLPVLDDVSFICKVITQENFSLTRAI